MKGRDDDTTERSTMRPLSVCTTIHMHVSMIV